MDDRQKMRKILQLSTELICDNLDPGKLLFTMESNEALSNDQVTLIRSHVLKREQCKELINILRSESVESYDKFMDALHRIRYDLYKEIKAIEKQVGYSKTEAGGEDVLDGGNSVNPYSSVRSKKDAGTPPFSGQPSDDEYDDVAPDSDGDYTERHILSAKPTKEQLVPQNNYNMNSQVKGLAYILNIKCFQNRKDRLGSDVDFRNMKHLFTELGYEIVPHENLTAEGIRQTIKTFVSKFDDPDSYLSSVVVLMSHGGTGYIVGTDNDKVTLKDIQAEFERCQNLKGKPKLFFVQACRGKSTTTSDHVADDTEGDDADDIDVPCNADMYTAYATPEGYLSLRDKIEGSWFVQAIAEEFLSYAHKENLDSLMNKVSYRVTSQKRDNWYDYEKKKYVTAKQTPIVQRGMRKALYFLPKYTPTY